MSYNEGVETFRQEEYPYLKGNTYLDHAGTTLYSRSLLKSFSQDLESNLFGNPHSHSSPSALTSLRIEQVRKKTLQFFNAKPDDYDLVFVSNATSAVKIVVDGFRAFSPERNGRGRFWYGYHRDCHTSLVGVREAARSQHCFKDDDEVEKWIKKGQNFPSRRRFRREGIGLFAYPGQSNFTGRRLPLEWSRQIRFSKFKSRVFTLLDAASLATSTEIDLSDEKNAPDFMCVSFYKMFGFPDIGALIVRKKSAYMLRNRRYFGGGTVDMVISLSDPWHIHKEALHDSLEDGTLPFHSIIALDHAMDNHARLFGSMKSISAHTSYLTKLLFDGLQEISHDNGVPVCEIYNDQGVRYENASEQGGVIAFNIIRADGSYVGYADVEKLADAHHIYLRSGSLCNPGGFANYLGFSSQELKMAFKAGHSCTHPIQLVRSRPTGVIRASVGAMSTKTDVNIFIDFVENYFAQHRSSNTFVVSEYVNVTEATTSTGGDQPYPHFKGDKKHMRPKCALKRLIQHRI